MSLHRTFVALIAALSLACAPEPVPTSSTDVVAEVQPPPAIRGELERTPIKDRQYLRIRLRASAPASYRDSLFAAGAAFVSQFHGSQPVGVSAGRAALKRISQLPWLTVVNVDSTTQLRVTAQSVPWGVDSIGATYTHSTYGFTGANVKIAVIDDGMACSHPDLTVWGGYDFEAGSYSYCGVGGLHGTRVAGVIAAKDNTIDVVGVAPGAKIYSLRTCDLSGDCDLSETVDALNWAGFYGMQVVSMSIADCGGGAPSSSYTTVVTSLYNDGVPVVVGHAKNDQCATNDPVSTLAADALTIAVAAHDQNGSYLSQNHQYGSAVDFSAPTNVVTLNSAGGLSTIGQVSGAVPHVTGAFALLIEAGFSGVASMKARLAETAQDGGAPGKDNYYGYGRIRVNAAVVPRPGINNLTWCTGTAITAPGTCSMTAATANGAGSLLVRFVAYYSNAPSDSTVYNWGSATRDINVPAGDYTLTIKTRVKDAYNRFGAIVNIWDIPVCTGDALTAPTGNPSTDATGGCGGGGGGGDDVQ